MRIRLLGGFRVSVGARLIEDEEWRLRKAGNIIKLLALAPRHKLHREYVTGLLWPNLDAPSATNNLHHALHVARGILGPDSGFLLLRDEHLALCPTSPLWVDVEAFEGAAARARRVRDPESYRAALGMYTGELLPEDRYEEWAEARRMELRTLHLALLAEAAVIYEAEGDLAAAMAALREIISRESAHEEAHFALMRLLAATGHRHHALRQYERLEEALRELGAQPEPFSRRLYREILAGRVPSVASSKIAARPPEGMEIHPHNLPAPLTSFIGREREISEVEISSRRARLLTLTGAGGVGKTRLAMEAARGLIETFPDGVWLAELASLPESGLVPRAVAASLKVRERANHPLTDTLAGALRQKELLLVLDNCEHLIEDAARLADALLRECPWLRILATSREALGVAGEVEWVVPPLSTPEDAVSGETSESVRLFLDRARLRRPNFVPTEENVRAAEEICRRLDGVPLAVELAAARVGVLSLEQISTRLDDAPGFLTEGSRTATPRHRTLRATLAWSHALLDEPEKKLFRRLSVFAGGWTLEAAEAMGVEDTLDLLSKLVHKSLTTFAEGNPPRYKMLEPVRQYARGKLDESVEESVARSRHARFFLALAEEARPGINGVDRDAWRARLDAEHDNFRTALRWSLENGDVSTAMRVANAVFWFWFHRAHWKEGRGWLEEALAMSRTPTPERADALAGVGIFAWLEGDHDRARVSLEESAALCRKLGHRRGLVHPLHFLSMELLGRGETDAARALAEESAEIARDEGDGFDLAVVLANLGLAAHSQRDFEVARPALEESIKVCREIGDDWLLSLPFRHLGYTELREGNHERATELFEEGLSALRGVGEKWFVARAVETLAIASAMRGSPAKAARLFGAGEALREAVGATIQNFYQPDYDLGVAAARAELDEAAWEAALAEGRKMPPEEAIEYALSKEETPPAGEAASALTRREREVALLVASGMTNRRIAGELGISGRTVENHVAKILRKLGFRSRARIAAWVAEKNE